MTATWMAACVPAMPLLRWLLPKSARHTSSPMRPLKSYSLSIVIAMGIAALCWQSPALGAAARCSYNMAAYPSAIGRHTFLLASATPLAVKATVDTPAFARARVVPAQVMRIQDVAGFQEDIVRRGLRASGGAAVLIRYGYGPDCSPYPAADGAFDSTGVNGLYVGRLRAPERWIDGRPTFNVFLAQQYPLPLRDPLRYDRVRNNISSMTSEELFTMYRSLWAESVSVGDSSVERRIREWLRMNPSSARKRPAEQVTSEMLSEITNATTAAHTIPFGGTFAISVVVPGVDSVVMYGQTSSRTRPWIVDITRDSLTGVPVAIRPRSFALDVTTARTEEALVRHRGPTNPCAAIPIVIDALPIVPDADSTWSGTMLPSRFLDCAPPGSVLARLKGDERTTTVALSSTRVTFRRHSDGHITFDARTIEDGKANVRVHGERVSN